MQNVVEGPRKLKNSGSRRVTFLIFSLEILLQWLFSNLRISRLGRTRWFQKQKRTSYQVETSCYESLHSIALIAKLFRKLQGSFNCRFSMDTSPYIQTFADSHIFVQNNLQILSSWFEALIWRNLVNSIRN